MGKKEKFTFKIWPYKYCNIKQFLHTPLFYFCQIPQSGIAGLKETPSLQKTN